LSTSYLQCIIHHLKYTWLLLENLTHHDVVFCKAKLIVIFESQVLAVTRNIDEIEGIDRLMSALAHAQIKYIDVQAGHFRYR
jgi:hypothetical protein